MMSVLEGQILMNEIDTLHDRLYDYYATLDTTNIELNYESYVDQSF
jgi:hypothetical protein